MNIGVQTTDWLYEDLQVDKKWSIKTDRGFKWWADDRAQTIEVVGEEDLENDDGEKGYYIAVRTEFLKSVQLTKKLVDCINGMLMPIASLSGPVYDADSNKIEFFSMVMVHHENVHWMNKILSFAALLQINEVQFFGSEIEKIFQAKMDISGHPKNGMRPEPDDLTNFVPQAVMPMGKHPSKWNAGEFNSFLCNHMGQSPAEMATGGEDGLTVEFPFGNQTSLCRFLTDQPHPLYGNGLLVLQTFPVRFSGDKGKMSALILNNLELSQRPFGYGLGSYAYQGKNVNFVTFFPNAVYNPNILPNFYHSCAHRSGIVSSLLLDKDWQKSVGLQQSFLGKIFYLFKR